MKRILKIFLLLFCVLKMSAQEVETSVDYTTEENISYIDVNDNDSYRQERCKLDVYYPNGQEKFPVLIWFHGGRLTKGKKYIPERLKEQGVVVVAVNYRLSPHVKHPAYIEDAAEAIAWTFNHVEAFGGDRNKIFVAGHSAGGYLTLMTGLDKTYLQKHGINSDDIRGLVPVGSQTNTHMTIRRERGLPPNIPIIDEYAPLNHAREGLPPVLLITGDRKLEQTARYEENLHLEVMLKFFRNDVELCEMQGFNHVDAAKPAMELILKFIKKHL